jgi:hyperosmotically inducible periplasmic protein
MHKTRIAARLGVSLILSVGTALADDSHVKSDQPVTDSYITTKVKASLAADKGTKARDIHVDTKEGVVMLSGTVGSTAEKELAEKDARKIKGVVQVRNDLTVQPTHARQSRSEGHHCLM